MTSPSSSESCRVIRPLLCVKRLLPEAKIRPSSVGRMQLILPFHMVVNVSSERLYEHRPSSVPTHSFPNESSMMEFIRFPVMARLSYVRNLSPSYLFNPDSVPTHRCPFLSTDMPVICGFDNLSAIFRCLTLQLMLSASRLDDRKHNIMARQISGQFLLILSVL